MGRHVNFADEQDRWLTKADKINRNSRYQSLEERDPATLSLAEQFQLEKTRIKAVRKVRDEKLAAVELAKSKPKESKISFYKPK